MKTTFFISHKPAIHLLILLVPLAALMSFYSPSDFISEQKKSKRVQLAIAAKEKVIGKKLKSALISKNQLQLLIVAYKESDTLEVYGKNFQNDSYQKIASYRICARSGSPGPKQKQGDGQVPEGFYHIDRFNPYSNFYLSLGLNYPNLADQRKNKSSNPGGDIFIHGSCVTIGCLPMTNDYIQEIYLMALYAKSNGQDKIPVYIFPFKMTASNMKVYQEKYGKNKALISFWQHLKKGYDLFTASQKELSYRVTKSGDYTFEP